jgi:N-methylhydantoinase B
MKPAGQINIEIIKNATLRLLDEAAISIMRSGYSTLIKEVKDLSVSLHGLDGELLAQPVVQPIHLGNLVAQVRGVIRRYSSNAQGDAFIVNHPFEDCQNHASDTTIITPIYYKGEQVAWCANTAHKPDFGGKVPGSNAGDATDTIQEGLLIPPLLVVKNFTQFDHAISEIIRCNTRIPEIVLGDIRAQIGANFIVEQQLTELFDKFGKDGVFQAWQRWIDINEQVLRERIIELFPEGEFSATDYMDDDGVNIGQSYEMSVRMRREGGDLHFHFSSSKQASGPINFRPCMVSAVAFYCAKAVFAPELPNNGGFHKPLKLHLPAVGSLLNPHYLAPVNMYSMSSHRLADVVLMAMSKAIPDRVPAQASGYLAGIAQSGFFKKSQKRYVQYELCVGGSGGRPHEDGISGLDSNVTNTMNTSVETIESEFPVKMVRHELIPNSAGAGQYRGGLGVRRDYQMVSDTTFSIRSDRNTHSPQGVQGGGPALPGRCFINPETADQVVVHSKCPGMNLKRGDILSVQSAGGGGWGDPKKRNRDAVLADIKNGYITKDVAREQYGFDS